MEVNLDLVHAFESQYALLPVRPDFLLLPSDLKPFAKVSQDEGLFETKKGKVKSRWSPGIKLRVPGDDLIREPRSPGNPQLS